MASWLTSQLKAAGDLLEAVDRTAQSVSSVRDKDELAEGGARALVNKLTGASPLQSTPGFKASAAQTPVNLASRVARLQPPSVTSSLLEPGLVSNPIPASTAAPINFQPATTLQSSEGSHKRIPPDSASAATPSSPDGGPSQAPLPTVVAAAAGMPASQASQEEGAASDRGGSSGGSEPVSTKASHIPFWRPPEVTSTPQAQPTKLDPANAQLIRPETAPSASSAPEQVSVVANIAGQTEGSEQLPSRLSSTVSVKPISGLTATQDSLSQRPAATVRTVTPVQNGQQHVHTDSGPALGDDQDLLLDSGISGVKEARLVKVIETLKVRLERAQKENQQLEEMLHQADARASGGAGTVERLEDELAKAQAAQISAEAALSQALAVKDAEIDGLRSSVEGWQAKLKDMAARVMLLEKDNEAYLQERQASEGRILQALREEVVDAERRLEEERAAHASARKAFAQREQQLEAAMADSGAALSQLQRESEQRGARAAEAEASAASLRTQTEALARELRAVEEKLQVHLQGMDQSSRQALETELGGWKGACQKAQKGLQDAEARRCTAESEMQRLKSDVESLRKQATNSGLLRDLERQVREVTELLYVKQTQLEKMAAEKAAQQLTLERELVAARAEAERVRRRQQTDRAVASFSVMDEVVPMESLGYPYSRLANHSRVGNAVKTGAKFLDQGASVAAKTLRQYPLWRLIMFLYVVFVHMFIYFLLNRLQHRAFSVEMAHADLAHRNESHF